MTLTKQGRSKIAVLLIMLTAVLLVMPQITEKSMIIGSDSLFHFNRFYDAAMQLKEGNFQYFISMYGFQQSGRIVNSLYGPLVAYFHGLLVLITPSWFWYQFISNSLLYLLAGFSMYTLLRKFDVRLILSVILAITFMTTFSIQYWILRQAFTSWGAALLPLCMLPVADMMQQKKIKVLQLGGLTALMFQTHFFTSLLLVMIYLPCFVYAFCTSLERLKLVKDLLKSIGLYVLLTLNVWVTFAEIYWQNKILPPFIYQEMARSTVNDRSEYWLYTPSILAVILLAALILVVCHWRHLSPACKMMMSLSGVFLFLSTNFIPWQLLLEHKIKMVETIQFPFRFFVPATVLVLLGAGLLLKELRFKEKQTKAVFTWALGISVFFSICQTLIACHNELAYWQTQDQFIQTGKHTVLRSKDVRQIKAAFFSHDKKRALDLAEKSTPDYLPIYQETEQNKYDEYEREVMGKTPAFTKHVANKKLVIEWTGTEAGWREVPIVKYAKTKLVFNHKEMKTSDLHLSTIGTVSLLQRKGKNQLVVSYEASKFFDLSLAVSSLAWLSLLLLLVLGMWQRKRSKQLGT